MSDQYTSPYPQQEPTQRIDPSGSYSYDPYLIPPPPPSPPPRSHWKLWTFSLLALLLLENALLVGYLLGNHQVSQLPSATTATPGTTQTPGYTVTPSPAAVSLTSATASALVTQFYDYINAKNYDAAYDLLSPEWQQNQSRQDFINGFQGTIQDTITIDGTLILSDGTIQVNVTVQAQETGGYATYLDYYIVTQENGKLLLLTGGQQTL